MILRAYGNSIHSVELNFDSRVLTEIGFRRDHTFSLPTEDFEGGYERVSSHELTARADGPVHDEVEQAILDDLAGQVESLVAGLGEGQVLLIESTQGVDYPKTNQTKKNVIVNGENRFHFHCRVEPPLRVGVYTSRGDGS